MAGRTGRWEAFRGESLERRKLEKLKHLGLDENSLPETTLLASAASGYALTKTEWLR